VTELLKQVKDNWDLDFLDVDDFIELVEKTMDKMYSKHEGKKLKDFNERIIDPIKTTFDMAVNNFSKKEWIEAEIDRQADKSVGNVIGHFHEEMFNLIEDWHSPGSGKGFDVIKDDGSIFIELKNKHNTINSSSGKSAFNKLKAKLEEKPEATTYIVHVINTHSIDEVWRIGVSKDANGDIVHNTDERIRKMSVDKLYEMATGDADAFKKVCEVLPIITFALRKDFEKVDSVDVIKDEIDNLDDVFLASIYKLAFSPYPSFATYDMLEKNEIEKFIEENTEENLQEAIEEVEEEKK